MGVFPQSVIQMADGQAKKIGDVQSGDRVACGDGRVATVRRVVVYHEQTQMANYHNFRLTPKHPVRDPSSERSRDAADAWRYVRDLNTHTSFDEYSALVNLELDEHHEAVGIHDHGTIAFLTLGHAGWSNPPVLFQLSLERCNDIGPNKYCSACGDYNVPLWKFACGCEYCWECIPRKCDECSNTAHLEE